MAINPSSPRIISGGSRVLFIAPDGIVWVWGTNPAYLVDQSEPQYFLLPYPLTGLQNIASVSAGGDTSYLLTNDGYVYAWGSNRNGGLGIGWKQEYKEPVKVPGIINIVEIAAGANHVVALRRDGTVWTWGGNRFGELGGNTAGEGFASFAPHRVTGLEKIVSVEAGDSQSFAVGYDGSVFGWGLNDKMQLGFGESYPTEENHLADLLNSMSEDDANKLLDDLARFWMISHPIKLPIMHEIRAIGSGPSHSLAIRKDGKMVTWGNNSTGQLGLGHRSPVGGSVEVPGVENVVAAAGGEDHSLAVTANGKLWRWGAGTVRFENGDYKQGTAEPTHVHLPLPVTATAASEFCSFAVLSDNSVWSWGYSEEVGFLGDGRGPKTYRPNPQKILG
jgi:alpha-tubulin suppressor-like RCC1 family protein